MNIDYSKIGIVTKCPDCEGEGSYIGYCGRCGGRGCAACVDGGVPEQCFRCGGTGLINEQIPADPEVGAEGMGE